MTTFPPEVVAAVLGHMNDDHAADSLVIVQAFAEPTATACTMSGLDGDAGEWSAEVDGTTRHVRIPWPAPALERADLRRQVVALHTAALDRLGLPSPESH